MGRPEQTSAPLRGGWMMHPGNQGRVLTCKPTAPRNETSFPLLSPIVKRRSGKSRSQEDLLKTGHLGRR